MSIEKQTENEELFGILSDTINGANYDDLNEAVYKILGIANYRKQIEGEWKVTRTAKRLYIKCLCCNYTKIFDRLESITDERRYILDDFIKEYTFCPNCGAKMKGGAE